MTRLTLARTILVAAVLLFALNILSLVMQPDRHPLATNTGRTHKIDLRLDSYDGTIEKLRTVKQTHSLKYLRTVNSVFAAGMLHYWPDPLKFDADVAYNWHENWFVYILRVAEEMVHTPLQINKFYFTRIERMDWRNVLAKGVGLCSQVSLALAGYLEEQGIETAIVALNGHVVATAKLKSEWIILDPDYNVVLPYDIRTAEQNPHLVAAHYQAAGYNPSEAKLVADIYGPTGNYTVTSWRYAYPATIAILVKWLAPVLLIFIGLITSRTTLRTVSLVRFRGSRE